MAAVGGPILFSPLELNLEFPNLPFPPLGPGFSLRGVGGNQDSARLVCRSSTFCPSPTTGKRGRSWRLPGARQEQRPPAGLFSALGSCVSDAAVQHQRLGPGLHSAPLLSGLLSHNPSHPIGKHPGGLGAPGPCLVSLETGQEQCQLSLAVFPSEPKAGAQGEWGAMLQGAGEVGRSSR